MAVALKGSNYQNRRFDLTDEHKLEHYKARKYEATFEKVQLVVKFIPGHEGKCAITKSFIDAIKIHDQAVKEIEEKWVYIDQLKRDLNKKTRTFRNMDAAWNSLNQRPDDFSEYLALIPRMKNIRERMKHMSNLKAKARAETELKRFEELRPTCLKLLALHRELNSSREIRDVAQKTLLEAETEFDKLRAREKELANLITDDHIVADEKKIALAEYFPNVHMGFVMHAINGQSVANMTYDECMQFVGRIRPPHKVDFRRYDYRYDPINGIWNSLPQVRELGTYVEDPMLTLSSFVQAASAGDINLVKRLLARGDDPDSTDYTGITALHAAAANGHLKVVELLIKSGAKIDKRDINMMSPLLTCVRRGNVELVWLLMQSKADTTASDINFRGVVFHAVLSGNPQLVKQFVTSTNCNLADKIWGFTPLHLAAYQGNLEMVQLLLTIGSNIYAKDKQGRSPEIVARDCGMHEIEKLLQEERLTASAQLVYSDPGLEINIWIGDESSMNPAFCSLIPITHVIYLSRDGDFRPPVMAWMSTDDRIQLFIVDVPDVEDFDEGEDSWKCLEAQIPRFIGYLTPVLKLGACTILICDYSGNSACVGLVAITQLLRNQIRIVDTLEACHIARPSVNVCMSIRTGLEILQRNIDARKLKRLEERTRNTVMGSIAF